MLLLVVEVLGRDGSTNAAVGATAGRRVFELLQRQLNRTQINQRSLLLAAELLVVAAVLAEAGTRDALQTRLSAAFLEALKARRRRRIHVLSLGQLLLLLRISRALLALVVDCREDEDVEQEQEASDGYRDRQGSCVALIMGARQPPQQAVVVDDAGAVWRLMGTCCRYCRHDCGVRGAFWCGGRRRKINKSHRVMAKGLRPATAHQLSLMALSVMEFFQSFAWVKPLSMVHWF